MESVQMFKTSDGKMFESKNEAEAHEEECKSATVRLEFFNALVAAGYSKELAHTLARGAAMYKTWLGGVPISPARKRVAKG